MSDQAVTKGDTYDWNGVDVTVTAVARDGAWANIACTVGIHAWTKRMPLPFPPSFVRAQEPVEPTDSDAELWFDVQQMIAERVCDR